MKYTVCRQLTVSLENTPGRLANILAGLAENSINIEAVSITDSGEQGIIRLVTSDASGCRSMLMRRGVSVVETEVLSMELTDSPGKLARISRSLGDASVNIEFAYATVMKMGEKTRLILKVSPLTKAREILDKMPEE